jgi:glycosyltransferase involved in cell wall biosynthesis
MRIKGAPNIYTIHDLVPLRLPYTTLDKKAKYLRLVKWICNKADHIVTVSESSKRDIVDLLGVEPEKITNTYEAVSIPAPLRDKPDDIVRREVEGTFGLTYKNYFLFFGSIEPKKNIGRMIQGYLTSGVTTPLVIVGAQAWKSEKELQLLDAQEMRRELRPGQAGGNIVKLEYAPFALLVSLIRGAKAVLFPSLYEGFGLPVLESMTLGTPVLTSRTSSLPEIAGNAALMIDPYDPRAIAEGIHALDSNEPLRMELARNGLQQAERFSERAYAERLHGVYDNVLTRR